MAAVAVVKGGRDRGGVAFRVHDGVVGGLFAFDNLPGFDAGAGRGGVGVEVCHAPF